MKPTRVDTGLTERQRQVLAAIVDHYIESAEPVGSKTLVMIYSLSISSATVRSVMGELEELGYVEQPHVSSGRVPTEKAYRFYIDHVLAHRPQVTLEERERRRLLRPYETATLDQLEDLFAFTSRFLSQLSHYIGIVVNAELRESTLERLELVSLGGTQMLVVLVTRPGLVKHRIFSIDTSIESAKLSSVAALLNERLAGRTLREIQEFASEMATLHALLDGENRTVAVQIARRVFLKEYENDIYWDGIRNFVVRAEFMATAGALSEALESRQRIAALFDASRYGTMRPGEVSVLIGSEIPDEGLERCSVIAASYRLSGQMRGTVGIIGPIHMKYPRLIPLVAYTSDLMTHHFTTLP
jgi:heat-inducible transcriptional repressor